MSLHGAASAVSDDGQSSGRDIDHLRHATLRYHLIPSSTFTTNLLDQKTPRTYKTLQRLHDHECCNPIFRFPAVNSSLQYVP